MCIGLNTSQNPAKERGEEKTFSSFGESARKILDLIKSEFLGVYSMPFLHMHLWYCGARSSVHLFSCRGSEKGEFEEKNLFPELSLVFQEGEKTFREK